MLWLLLRTLFFLLVAYYSIKFLFAAFAGPLLRPFGLSIGMVGLRSGLTDVQFTPKPRSSSSSSNTGSSGGLGLVSLGLGNARVSVLFGERKVALTVSGVRLRLRINSTSAVAPLVAPNQQQQQQQQSLKQAELRDAADRIVTQLARSLKNASRALRVVVWVGLIEVYVVGLDVVVVDATNVPILTVRDEALSLHLKTDVVSPPTNEGTKDEKGVVFAVNVELAPFTATSGPEDAPTDIIKLANETRLVVLCNLNSNTHSIDLTLPEVSVQSVYTVAAVAAKFKKPKPPKQPGAGDLADILQAEYAVRKDFYISLLRNAFLSSVHNFHPTLRIHIVDLCVNMPTAVLDGFEEFDLELPQTTARLNNLTLSCTLNSKPGEVNDADRILWLESTLYAKNLNVDVELRPSYKSSIASLPELNLRLDVSIPLLSVTQSSVGQIVLNSTIDSLCIVLPSRLFLFMMTFLARKKSLRKPEDSNFEKSQFWPKLFRRHFVPVINVTLNAPFLGFRCGSYNGINDSDDAVIAIFCESMRCVNETSVLSTSPIRPEKKTRSSSTGDSFKLVEVRIFMTPLFLEGFVVDPYNQTSFAEQRMASVRKQIGFFTESRTLVTALYTRTTFEIHIESEFAEFMADLTCLGVPGGLDFFGVATFFAGLLHKITVVKNRFPLQAPPFPLFYYITLKTPRLFVAASENTACALAGTADHVVFQIIIDPDINQTMIMDGVNISIDAISEFSTPITPEGDWILREQMVASDTLSLHFKKLMVPEGLPPKLTLVCPTVDFHFNLRRFYVCFTSYLPVFKMTKIISSRDGGATGLDLDITLQMLNLDAVFANNTQLKAAFQELNGTFVDNAVGKGNIKNVALQTLDDLYQWQEVVTIDNVVLGFLKETVDHMIISIEGEEAIATNPPGFEFSDLFEDMINMQKGVKSLIMEKMGLVSMARLTAGKTVFQKKEMPEYRVKLGKFVFRILDDEFESKLSRNYRLGCEEQFGRLAREKAFQKKAHPLRDENTGEATELLEECYWAVQEYNSKSWIKRISKANTDFPPLLNATIINLNVVVTPPTMPCPTIEETIHYIDHETPVELEYDDLICRDVSMSISELVMQLRDFPVPLVHVPAVNTTTTWRTEGLLIIADLLASAQSKRFIDLSLSPVNVPPITVSRNLCPVKIYMQSSTNIKVGEKSPLFMSWGMCVEPPLADMIRVLDTFTKASVDPSPPVGWWDKMRHMVHLGRTVVNISDGDFKLRILGSYTPHYDARYHYGTEGVDIAFGKGVRIEFSDRINENIMIESGRCTWSIPNSIHEAGRISGAHRAEVKDEIFGQFVGGVKIAAGIHFTTYKAGSTEETDIWKSHSDVILKLPEDKKPADGTVVDSYYGFRSKCIHVVYNITSPHSGYDKNGASSNFLSFTNDSFRRFVKLIPVYQSPLAIIPIRRGRLWEKTVVLEKPKLGRSIKTNKIKGFMVPLLLSYLCEFEDATGGVGLRFGAHKMDFDLIFEQKNITVIKEGMSEASNTTRWVLQTAEVEFTEVEGRTLSFGSERFGSENKYRSSASAAAVGGAAAKQIELDHKKWFLDIDYNFVTKHFDMIPFIWSPKVKYFKRSEDFKFEAAHKIHTEAEVHKDQIKLYQKRKDDLESIIRQYVNHQKALADKKEIMLDDSVMPEIDLITSKLENLFEKKTAIEKHIRNSQIHIREYETNTVHTEYSLSDSSNKENMFDHHYVMHNIRFLWKRDVRNIVLRFLSLLSRDSALSYCLSNAALKTVKELLSLSIKQAQKEKKEKRPSFDPDSELLGEFESGMTEDLLDQLLNDMDNLIVNHEQSNEPAETQSVNSDTSTPLADLMSYTPSSDPNSPDYVARNMCVNSSYIIQCINPQVNFESAPKTNTSALHSVVVVAETMQFRSIHILESTAHGSNMNLDESQRQNEDLVKVRTILNIQNAQFFTCAFEDAQKDVYTKPFMYNYRDSVVEERVLGSKVPVLSFWPMWVPIENITWNDFEVDQCLERVVGRTSAAVYRDKPNPLYVRRNSSTTKADFTDSYTVDFPDFRIEANSKQFFYVLDIVTNLLMYHDPTSGERSKRLRKMMLALDQMSDLTVVLDSVLVLQEKIRQGAKLLRFGQKIQDSHYHAHSHHHHQHHYHQQIRRHHQSHHSLIDHKPVNLLNEQQSDDVRKRLLQFQEEMYVIMEGLKALSILEQKRNSLEVALQVNIHAKNLVWTMSQDNGSNLAQWTISDSRFSWIQNEDQSSLNTLEIDKLHLENLMVHSAFRNMISPFGDTKFINFARNKMVRVYWREMAPVAGIRVVDHFEMNIYPLLLQITRETGKALEKYFFPKSTGAEDDEISASDSPEKKAVVAARAKKAKLAQPSDDFKEMQTRAAENRSFVYIKVPTLQLCLSYKGLKEKNIEDLNQLTFLMPTMEYRNKTWAWQDFFSAVKKDAIRAVFHNSGALVQQKLFAKKNAENEDGIDVPVLAPETGLDKDQRIVEDSGRKGKGLFQLLPGRGEKTKRPDGDSI
ncbi:hypothetical protein HDU79_006035 [Rhizoclosmatium sp. JEL0117]|nr:hypothetical protein HDU79_006035 [Rhizoclosmatium sp. JEL0117]